MKYKPKPALSFSVMTRPGQVVSVDLVGPFKVRSVNNSLNGLAFIEHFTNMPFLYALNLSQVQKRISQIFEAVFIRLPRDVCRSMARPLYPHSPV